MLRARQHRVRVIAAAAAVASTFGRKPNHSWEKSYRRKFTHSPLISHLREYSLEDYKSFMRMDAETFDDLLAKVTPFIQREETLMRPSFSSKSRLVATLRFLVTGTSFEQLQFSTGMSPTTLRQVIPETCKAIVESLKKEYMKFPSTEEKWQKVTNGFEKKWQFINCGGALDGKHIRVLAPRRSGASFFNYKGYYSVVLMALVDSNYEFIYADVGKNGRFADGGVVEDTSFFIKLKAGSLNLPPNQTTKENLNYVFLADEAFPLLENLVKPYAQRELDHEKRIFNYRLSRGRNVAEDAFRIITNRFAVLQRPINLKHEDICYVVMAVCVLHNYLRRRCAVYSQDDIETTTERRTEQGQPHAGLDSLQEDNFQNGSIEAVANRDKYKEYFNTVGAVEWQEEKEWAELEHSKIGLKIKTKTKAM